jgi:hypothetical protein
MSPNNYDIEKRIWDAADELRANSKLKSIEYFRACPGPHLSALGGPQVHLGREGVGG